MIEAAADPEMLPLTEEVVRRLAVDSGAIEDSAPPLVGERRAVFLEVAMGALKPRDWQYLRAVLEHDTMEKAAAALGVPKGKVESRVIGAGDGKSIADRVGVALSVSPRWAEVNRLAGAVRPDSPPRRNFLGDGRWFEPAFPYRRLVADTWTCLAALAVIVDLVDRSGRVSAQGAHEGLGPQVAAHVLPRLRMMGYIEYDGAVVRIVKTPYGPWED